MVLAGQGWRRPQAAALHRRAPIAAVGDLRLQPVGIAAAGSACPQRPMRSLTAKVRPSSDPDAGGRAHRSAAPGMKAPTITRGPIAQIEAGSAATANLFAPHSLAERGHHRFSRSVTKPKNISSTFQTVASVQKSGDVRGAAVLHQGGKPYPKKLAVGQRVHHALIGIDARW